MTKKECQNCESNRVERRRSVHCGVKGLPLTPTIEKEEGNRGLEYSGNTG
jgi:hypothetical protein